MTVPVFYERPDVVGSTLGVEPALASWDRAGSPGQVRSAVFVAEVHSAIVEQVRVIPDPLALRLDIGLPAMVPLLELNDLDNYLFPLVPKLTAGTGRRFVSVWARKRRAATSSIAVCQARIRHDPGGSYSFQVCTTASASTSAYKQQIRDQIADRSAGDADGDLPGRMPVVKRAHRLRSARVDPPAMAPARRGNRRHHH